MARDIPAGRVGQFVPGEVPRSQRARYLPIAEHGLIGDLHTVALVGTDGTIDWYCCPRFAGLSALDDLLDELEHLGARRIDQVAAPDSDQASVGKHLGHLLGHVALLGR